jgi:hypothetical protein
MTASGKARSSPRACVRACVIVCVCNAHDALGTRTMQDINTYAYNDIYIYIMDMMPT